MLIFFVIVLTILIVILGTLFFFLHKRLEDMGRRMGNLYAMIDVLNKNQEELLAQNLKVLHDIKKAK